MQEDRQESGPRPKTWVQIAEGLTLFVLLAIILGGAIYFSYVAP
jgi:hypothetical protein